FGVSEQTGLSTVENISGGHKLEVYDWMEHLPNPLSSDQIYEIQFKNTRKGFYINSEGLSLHKGDIVVVESQPGLDIGTVSMCGDLVARQMKRTGCEFKKILRRPGTYDIERWQEAIALEHSTMIRSRVISSDLGLDMKIGDVEYQADRLKAIFYYIADQRVDFRELIKILAEQFRIRVEMKQIGARQEAGRIGGIAGCGRELCCSTWQNNFSSVGINAARVQDISPNPQKLAGQCGKLKCCLNYEMDVYADARSKMPRINGPLEAMDAQYHLIKADVLRGLMYFASNPHSISSVITLGKEQVREIIAINRRGEKIESIESYSIQPVELDEPTYENVVGQDSLTRFDSSSRGGRGGRGRNNRAARGTGGDKVADGAARQAAPQESPTPEKSTQERAPQNRPPQNNRPARGPKSNSEPQSAKTVEGEAENRSRSRNNNNRRRASREGRPARTPQEPKSPKTE
ncbi:MAG: regulatory iron-sulfur-containing complex subunit RicT, partial [Mucinivorans sp.]